MVDTLPPFPHTVITKCRGTLFDFGTPLNGGGIKHCSFPWQPHQIADFIPILKSLLIFFQIASVFLLFVFYLSLCCYLLLFSCALGCTSIGLAQRKGAMIRSGLQLMKATDVPLRKKRCTFLSLIFNLDQNLVDSVSAHGPQNLGGW